MKPHEPKAVVLSYSSHQDIAPRIVAKGRGELAKRIIQLARENNLPMFTDPALADFLLQLAVGDPIPPVVYQVVAEIYAFFTEIKGDV